MLLSRLEVNAEGDERPDSTVIPLIPQTEPVRLLCFPSAPPVRMSRKTSLEESWCTSQWGGGRRSRCTEQLRVVAYRKTQREFSENKKEGQWVCRSRDAHLKCVTLEGCLNDVHSTVKLVLPVYIHLNWYWTSAQCNVTVNYVTVVRLFGKLSSKERNSPI